MRHGEKITGIDLVSRCPRCKKQIDLPRFGEGRKKKCPVCAATWDTPHEFWKELNLNDENRKRRRPEDVDEEDEGKVRRG